MPTPDIDEALRYLGVPAPAPEQLREQAARLAGELCQKVRPRWVWRAFPITRDGDGFVLEGTGLHLGGHTAGVMLAPCRQAAVLACTLGAYFDTLLRERQARSMADAVILDALGSAYVEAGCDAAERELAGRFPAHFLTDRFSPGYGDLPLELQPGICAALDAERRLGVHVSESLLMNPVKTVTAVIGLSERPQAARIRGCEYCPMGETCQLRKGGTRCEAGN